MRIKNSLTGSLLLVLILLVSGGSAGLMCSRPGQALMKGPESFESLGGDSRIHYQEGMKGAAEATRAVLDSALQQVVDVHGHSFNETVRIYICNTQASFNEHIGAHPSGVARGAVFNQRLFLAPRTFDDDSYGRILTHELSHLQLIQQLGSWTVIRKLPGWFQEGLAVYVSGGGGAERITNEKAIEALRQGRSFYPDLDGSLFVPKHAGAYRLQHHMFYKQAAMYTEFLAETDPEAFRGLMRDIQAGHRFAVGMQRYGTSNEALWASFLDRVIAGSP